MTTITQPVGTSSALDSSTSPPTTAPLAAQGTSIDAIARSALPGTGFSPSPSSPLPVATVALTPISPAPPQVSLLKPVLVATPVDCMEAFIATVEEHAGELERGDILALDYHGTLTEISKAPGIIEAFQRLRDRGVNVIICTGGTETDQTTHIKDYLKKERGLTLNDEEILCVAAGNKGKAITDYVARQPLAPRRVALLDDTRHYLCLATLKHLPFHFVAVEYVKTTAAGAFRAPTLPRLAPSPGTSASPDQAVAATSPGMSPDQVVAATSPGTSVSPDQAVTTASSSPDQGVGMLPHSAAEGGSPGSAPRAPSSSLERRLKALLKGIFPGCGPSQGGRRK